MYYIKKEVGCAEKNPAKKIMHFVLKSSILICHPQLPLSSSNRFRTRNAYKLRGVTVNKFWVSAWSLQAFWNEQKSQEFNGIASNFKSSLFTKMVKLTKKERRQLSMHWTSWETRNLLWSQRVIEMYGKQDQHGSLKKLNKKKRDFNARRRNEGCRAVHNGSVKRLGKY